MNEREQARKIADLWLAKGDDFGRIDPDGDQCVVARSYMRALEKIERLTGLLKESNNSEIGLRGHVFDKSIKELADEWPKAVQ